MISKSKGFTLVEVLVTLTLIAIIASIAFPLIQVDQKRRNEQLLRDNLTEIRKAIDNYKQASDDGRILRMADQTGYPADLQTLVDGVPDLKDPQGRKVYFLRRIPADPFAPIQDSLHDASKTWKLRSYASEANNPQAGDDVYDVSSRSSEKALNGSYYDHW